MQAQPQLVPQAPVGQAVPNLHDRLAVRLANATIANQCVQGTGVAASSTAALRAAVAANANPRPVLYEPTVFTGNITPGSIISRGCELVRMVLKTTRGSGFRDIDDTTFQKVLQDALQDEQRKSRLDLFQVLLRF